MLSYIGEFRDLQYSRLFIGPLALTFSMGISIYCQFAVSKICLKTNTIKVINL